MANKHEHSAIGGLRVEVRNGNVEQAIRRFKKLVAKSGKLQELREKEFFTSNTEKRIKAEASAKARHRRRIARDDR